MKIESAESPGHYHAHFLPQWSATSPPGIRIEANPMQNFSRTNGLLPFDNWPS